jgi:DNA adenine methylase
MREGAPPAPFLKWAGGKRQLLPRILAFTPRHIDTYVEPFLGGGAVFFALAAEKRFGRAILGDANGDLIACYTAVRDDVEAVIEVLRGHRNDAQAYYDVRAEDPAKLAPPSRAARVIYLNRCGFNGLYRVNASGRFNVPFGRYARPHICDPERLRAASVALRGVEIVEADFDVVLARHPLGPRDFVYFDPPYVPMSRTASFTAYTGEFGAADQERLARALASLATQRVPALLSNSDCSVTRALYAKYGDLVPRKVRARRSINSVAGRRGPVDEILVRSFRYPLRAKEG